MKPSNSDNWFSDTACGKGERSNFDFEYEGHQERQGGVVHVLSWLGAGSGVAATAPLPVPTPCCPRPEPVPFSPREVSLAVEAEPRVEARVLPKLPSPTTSSRVVLCPPVRSRTTSTRCSGYLRRFDLEHTFRLFKQTLGWTRPKLRDPRGRGPLDVARDRRAHPAPAGPAAPPTCAGPGNDRPARTGSPRPGSGAGFGTSARAPAVRPVHPNPPAPAQDDRPAPGTTPRDPLRRRQDRQTHRTVTERNQLGGSLVHLRSKVAAAVSVATLCLSGLSAVPATAAEFGAQTTYACNVESTGSAPVGSVKRAV